MQQLKSMRNETGSGRVIAMVVLVVILAGGYYALHLYTSGQQKASMVEGRGGAVISALGGFKRETGNLPDALDKLVPKYLPAVSKCPDGQPYAYKASGADFTLSCQGVMFGKPYQYDSKTRAWAG